MILRRYIEEPAGEDFDLVIIGGGITGAAVAYIAAARGLKVALFEKKDYGGATSAATSKLIHGGLRYLANGELKLVRESLRERRILGNIAPNFVYPLPFVFPNYKKWGGNIWKMMVGMYLYDMLSYDKKDTWDRSKKLQNHRLISHRKTVRLEPNLRQEKLRNAFYFFDYQSIFPERLTLAFIKSAAEYGARVSNYTPVEGFIFDAKSRITGVKVRDIFTGKTMSVKADLVINCGGTWADKILGMASEKDLQVHKIKRSEGIHIITKRIAGNHVVSIQRDDGGHMMIMPWRDHSLIGTTDKEYMGDPDDYHVSRESVNDVIEAVNRNFGRKISIEDVTHAYGGLRPLIDDQTKGTYQTSRKYEVYDNAVDGIEGMITVEGGKYTTSRGLAQEVLKLISVKLKRTLSDYVSDNLYLSGCEIRDMKQFMIRQHLNYIDFDRKTIEYVSRNYGTDSKVVFQIARDDKQLAGVISHDGEILAEVVYAIKYESARTLQDIMLRRTGTGTLGNPGMEIIGKIASLAAELLNWDKARTEAETASILKIYELH
ncbi:MAG: glycerol-3-phosphate dehydrogenase/oxidase [Bacteroidales bacterium]|jgi:glycerol-3-phosphate dehydrogenase|nr:glycerol-3-phosphate dehydrogenase/oxidase [Bacteroidales bacterium]